MEGSGYFMLVGGDRQSGGQGTDGGGIYGDYAASNASHSPTLTSKNPHLFNLSCLHCAYITKIGYETNLIIRSE